MKRFLFILFICVIPSMSSLGQGFDVFSYKFYAQYDGQGKDISSTSNYTGLSVTVASWTDFYGNTSYVLFGSESHTVAGMPAFSPLCPVNDQLKFVGIRNGWRVFNYMNTVIVSISSDSNIARVEKYGFNNYLGYTEYRK